MDEMRLETDFGKWILTKSIEKAVKKKTGKDIEVYLKNASIKNDEKTVTVELNGKVTMSTEDLKKLLNY